MGHFKRNISYVYITNAINGILGIVLVPLSIKMMGTSGYGLFSIYSVIMAYLVLVDLGVSKNLFRKLSAISDDNLKINDLRIASGIYLIICVVLIVATPLLIIVIPRYIFPVAQENLFSLRLIILLSVIEYILTVPMLLLQINCASNEKFDLFSKFTLVTGIYRYILLFLGVYIFGTPVAIVAIMAFRRILDCAAAYKIMGPLPQGAWVPIIDFKAALKIVSLSSALAFALFFQSSINALGSFLVNKHFGLSGLGIYRAVFDLVNKIWFVSNGLALVLFPKFAQMLSSEERKKQLFSIMFATLCLSWAGYCLLSVVGITNATEIIGLLGFKQPEIPVMFAVLLLGICINSHTFLSFEFLQAAGRYRIVAILNLVAFVTMYLSFRVLLGTCGLYAISWAWIISQLLYCLLADAMTLFEIYATLRSQLKILVIKFVIFAIPIIAVFRSRFYESKPIDISLVVISLVVFILTCAIFNKQYRYYQKHSYERS